MKLTDIIYSVSSCYRNAGNFIRHPFDILSQQGRRVIQERVENLEVPLKRPHSDSPTHSKERQNEQARSPQLATLTAPASPIPATVSTRASGIHHPTRLPTLAEQEEIRGRRGRYRRTGSLATVQEWGCWYEGICVLNNKPVLIKEYLLSEREFSPSAIRERKEKFAFLANLNLRNSGGQDFRLVNVYDAIAPFNTNEHCCYLVSELIPQSQTLREFLTLRGTLSAHQVRHILNQVLQTLWFLHHQKIRGFSGEIQYGVPHGNLSLDSLLIAPAPLQEMAIEDDQQFFVYTTDLALWEHLFLPGSSKPPTLTPAQDLVDLGYVGVSLLTGHAESYPNLMLDPSWADVTDLPLKQFMQQLVRGDFKANVEEARQTLLNLPQPQPDDEAAPLAASPSTTTTTQTQILCQLAVLGLLVGCLGLLVLGWQQWIDGVTPPPGTAQSPCCLSDVALSNTAVTYTAEAGSVWHHILRARNLVAFNRSLEQVLQERDRRFRSYQLDVTQTDALADVQAGRTAFALTEWNDSLPAGLHQEVVAFDGLAILVAFGDAERSQSIPQALQGSISLEQLRQLYSGASPNWRIPRDLRSWNIQLYRSADQETIERFERLVLQNEEAIAQFRQLSLPTVPATQMFGEILQDFEQRNTIGIGFARLSQVIHQCSVYPLAVRESGQAVQALAENQGQAINPSTDLCRGKGSYRSNIDVFNSNRYPLMYRLTVVHRQDSQVGQQFAAALKTDEGQALLSAAGLVPLRQLSHP